MTDGAQKSLLIALIFAAFLAGLFSAPDHSKEVIKKLEKDRAMLIEGIIHKQAQVTNMEAEKKALLQTITDTVSFYSSEVSRRDLAIHQMKRRNENRSFRTYSDKQLDSLRTRYYVLYAD